MPWLDRDDFKELLAFMNMVAGWSYLFCLLFAEIGEKNERFADVGLGIVGTIIFGKILSDYFGNSEQGEEELRKKIEEQIKEQYGIKED